MEVLAKGAPFPPRLPRLAASFAHITGGAGSFDERLRTLNLSEGEYEALCAGCVAAGALVPLVHALQGDADCEAAASTTLRNITSFAGPAEACAHSGAVPALLAVLQRSEASPEVVASACGALRNVVLGEGEAARARKDAYAADAIPLLVDILRDKGSAIKCWAACDALQSFAACGAAASESRRKAAERAPEALLDVVRHFTEVTEGGDANAQACTVCRSASAALKEVCAMGSALRVNCVLRGAPRLLHEALDRHELSEVDARWVAARTGLREEIMGVLACLAMGPPEDRFAADGSFTDGYGAALDHYCGALMDRWARHSEGAFDDIARHYRSMKFFINPEPVIEGVVPVFVAALLHSGAAHCMVTGDPLPCAEAKYEAARDALRNISFVDGNALVAADVASALWRAQFSKSSIK